MRLHCMQLQESVMYTIVARRSRYSYVEITSLKLDLTGFLELVVKFYRKVLL